MKGVTLRMGSAPWHKIRIYYLGKEEVGSLVLHLHSGTTMATYLVNALNLILSVTWYALLSIPLLCYLISYSEFNSLKEDSVIILLYIKWCTLITLNTLLLFLLYIFSSSLVFYILLLSQYSTCDWKHDFLYVANLFISLNMIFQILLIFLNMEWFSTLQPNQIPPMHIYHILKTTHTHMGTQTHFIACLMRIVLQ